MRDQTTTVRTTSHTCKGAARTAEPGAPTSSARPLVSLLFAVLLLGGLVLACDSDDDTEAGDDDGEEQPEPEPAQGQSFAQWQALNDGLLLYEPLHEEWHANKGIHWGVDGPHLTVGVGHEEDQVTFVELVVPAEEGWHPWFDQPENEPIEIDGADVYTQHIYLVEPATIDEVTEAEPLPMTLEGLETENPALSQYGQISGWVPQMGYHWGHTEGPNIVLALGEENEVNAFELIVPEEQGWFPWFDQPENEPSEIGGELVYTQHIYIVPPESIESPEQND